MALICRLQPNACALRARFPTIHVDGPQWCVPKGNTAHITLVLGIPLSSARQFLKLLGNNFGQVGISLLRMPDDLVVACLGITCFELAAVHIAHRCALLPALALLVERKSMSAQLRSAFERT